MDYFEQTSKTILFEKFATEDVDGSIIPSLALFLSNEDAKEVEKGGFHTKIIDTLGVRSFEEFFDKFTPWVYEMIEPGETEDSVEIKYYLEKPDHYDETGMNPTALDKTAIYELVNRLYEQRKSSGVTQLNFDFSDVAKILSPESQTEKIKQARRSMKYAMDEYYKLEEKTPGVPSAEKARAIKIIRENRIVVQDAYMKGSTSLLTLKLGDATNALLSMGTTNEKETFGDGKNFIGIPDYDENGELKIRKLEFDDNDTKQIGCDSDEKLWELLKEDYENTAPEYMQKSDEITNLVLSNISTGLTRTDHTKEFWIKRLQSGQQDYKKWMENLAYTIAPLVEKFIGVKAFFENATANGKLDSVLIVANSTVSELIATDGIKDKFIKFLSNVNREITKKIWFGIIPAISLGDEETDEEDDSLDYDPNDPFAMNTPTKKKKVVKTKSCVSSADAKILLDICEKVGIMTFYNFKANRKTCFGGIDKSIYERMKNRIVFEKGDHAICCLPNFTIIPEEERNVIINKKLVEAEYQKDYVSLQIPAIYVEASYVAAGMVVGCQQKELLINKGFNIDSSLTNIRFDLEGKDVYKKFQSNMCVENDLPVPRDMNEDIMKDRFGFYFSDKKIPGENGGKITHCYIRNARTMAKNPTTNTYEEMMNRLFIDFVMALLYGNEDVADPDYAEQIKKDDILKWMDYAQENKGLVDNALLKPSEKIESTDNVEFSFEFAHAKNRTKLKVKSN